MIPAVACLGKNKFHAFLWNLKVHCICLSLPLVPTICHILPPNFSKNYFNIILTLMPACSKWFYLSFKTSNLNTVCHMSHPSHLS